MDTYLRKNSIGALSGFWATVDVISHSSWAGCALQLLLDPKQSIITKSVCQKNEMDDSLFCIKNLFGSNCSAFYRISIFLYVLLVRQNELGSKFHHIPCISYINIWSLPRLNARFWMFGVNYHTKGWPFCTIFPRELI